MRALETKRDRHRNRPTERDWDKHWEIDTGRWKETEMYIEREKKRARQWEIDTETGYIESERERETDRDTEIYLDRDKQRLMQGEIERDRDKQTLWERERKSCSNSTRQLFSNTLGSEQTLQFIAIMCQSLRLACTYLTKWFFFKSHQCYDFKKCVVYGLLSISQYFKSQHWIHDDMTRLWCLSDLQHTAQAGMERADSRQV